MKRVFFYVITISVFAVLLVSCSSNKINFNEAENLRTRNFSSADDTGLKAIVVYYSSSGNTQKVAEVIARELNGQMVYVEEHKRFDLKKYDLLVIGSPVYGGEYAGEIEDFFEVTQGKLPEHCAVFCTYGMPGWGPKSSRMCLDKLKKSAKSDCIGEFRCPGFHAIARTYPSRPNSNDLEKARVFARRLASHFTGAE